METRLWFYYLAASYIDIGCEAFHLGQVGLIGPEDRNLQKYTALLVKIRAYVKVHARRHMVLFDAHDPTGGMVKNSVSLLDFNSFPLWIKDVPEKPYNAILQVNYLEGICKKRVKGVLLPADGIAIAFLTWLNLIIMERVNHQMLPIQQVFFFWG